eukprot:PhF_6_TR44185/c1_g1_i1/m.67737
MEYTNFNQDKAGFISRVLYSYATPMFTQGYRKLVKDNQPITLEDCINVPQSEATNQSYQEYIAAWKEELQIAERKQQPVRLVHVLFKAFSSDILRGGLCRLLSDASQFVTPILLRLIITFLKDSEAPVWQGFVWVALLAIANFLYAVFMNVQLGYNSSFAQKARCSLMTAVFQQTLNLPTVENTGNVIQLHASDSSKFVEVTQLVHTLWATPIILIAYVIQLWFYVGWAAVIGFAVMLVSIPVQGVVSAKVMSQRSNVVKATVNRVQVITEALQGIRICKFMCWEDAFLKKIDTVRRKELRVMVHFGNLKVYLFTLMLMIPTIVMYVVFSTSLELDGMFRSENVFPALAVLGGMRGPLMMFPLSIGRAFDVMVSMTRLRDYLVRSKRKNVVKRSPIVSEVPVKVKNAHIYYHVEKKEDKEKAAANPSVPEKKNVPTANATTTTKSNEPIDETTTKPPEPEKVFILNDASFEIERGSFAFILGPTGSGKSSLLHAMMDEGGVQSAGDIQLDGRIAYCSQEAWIMNATLKANVILGLPFDEVKYNKVVSVCQLSSDLAQLPNGDATEIGEKGINLSGGQRQRVSLARAMYHDADIYILDDPLSAVDAHVAHALMHECFLGYLSGRTRILVTHQTQFAHHADKLITLVDKGVTVQNGGVGLEESDFFRNNSSLNSAPKTGGDPASTVEATKEDIAKKEAAGKLVAQEQLEIGRVKWGVFSFYFGSMRYFVVFCVVIANILYQMSITLSNLWISWWPERVIHMSNNDYLLWWAVTNIGSLILTYTRQDIINTAQFISSLNLHSSVVSQVIYAPTSFYDVTPLGRLITVFTRDIECVDSTLPDTYSWTLLMLVGVIGSLGLVCVATPYISVVVVISFFGYYWLYNYYTVTYRGLKRLDGLYRAPVLSLMAECVNGLPSIRACGLTQWINEEHNERLERSAQPIYCMLLSMRWLSSRLEFIGTSIAFFCALLAVIQKVATSASSVDVAITGLAITSALTITQILSTLTRLCGEMEAQMNSVERIKHACETIPQERDVDYNEKNPAPALSWPTSGAIEFRNIDLRYRDGLPLVLKNISFKVPSGARVGIVGRTGSGKSTLLLALFRIVELSRGSIMLDNRDIFTLKMKDLRSSITVIPQDPVLFAGTILSNVDPFHLHTDAAVMNVIQKVNLGDRIKSIRDKVTERGANFSVGERQLLCMARALLKNCKVLLMDEATASVDNDTDAHIQKTIREEFRGCTVLTIAHRLRTVMDSDLVVVLKDGVLTEIGHPQVLLASSSDTSGCHSSPEAIVTGELEKMVQKQGEEESKLLHDIASGRISVVDAIQKHSQNPVVEADK